MITFEVFLWYEILKTLPRTSHLGKVFISSFEVIQCYTVLHCQCSTFPAFTWKLSTIIFRKTPYVSYSRKLRWNLQPFAKYHFLTCWRKMPKKYSAKITTLECDHSSYFWKNGIIWSSSNFVSHCKIKPFRALKAAILH